jgi:hypothetical protein
VRNGAHVAPEPQPATTNRHAAALAQRGPNVRERGGKGCQTPLSERRAN